MTLRSVVMTSQVLQASLRVNVKMMQRWKQLWWRDVRRFWKRRHRRQVFFRWKWDEIQLGKRMTRHVTPKKGRNIDQKGRFSSEELRCGTPCLGLHLDFKKLALLGWLQWFFNSLTSSYLFITREVQPVDSVAFLKLVRYVPFCWRAQNYLAMPKHWGKQLLGVDVGTSDDEKRWEQLYIGYINLRKYCMYIFHIVYCIWFTVIYSRYTVFPHSLWMYLKKIAYNGAFRCTHDNTPFAHPSMRKAYFWCLEPLQLGIWNPTDINLDKIKIVTTILKKISERHGLFGEYLAT